MFTRKLIVSVLGPLKIMVVYPRIIGQSLAARLVVPLPYLLYKTQARYEEDLRKIHEVKPIMSDAPLHRRALSEDGKRIPTLSRRTSSRAETIVTLPRSPRNLDKIVLPNLSSSRVQYAGTTTAVRSPTTLKNGASGSAVVSKALSTSSPSSETDSESIEDEGERKNEEREDVNRKLKELAKLVKSDGFGFAAGPSKDHRLSSGGAASGKGKEKQKEHMEVPCLSDVPETGESGREEEPESPPTTDSTSAGAHRRPQMAVKVAAPRTSRFSRDAIPSMPSSSSHSPSESPGRVANAYHPYEQTNLRTKPIPPRLEGEMQRHRSLSSQGSQASSFSDLSGQCRCAILHVARCLTVFLWTMIRLKYQMQASLPPLLRMLCYHGPVLLPECTCFECSALC